jgi:hypothetical protein
MKRFIKEYRVELLAISIIPIGIFLLLERLEIRATLRAAGKKAGHTAQWVLKQVTEEIGNRTAALTISDALGILLILLATGFIVWRIRHRFQISTRWSIDNCPKCSNPIMRVHRSGWDRFLGMTFMPKARRYRCVDPQCGWSGLLREHIHHHHRSERASDLENS